MRSLLETYGLGLVAVVFITIIIAFAGPMGSTVKGFIHSDVQGLTSKQNDTSRPAEPVNAVDKVYCILYDDNELVIAQNEIEPESGRTVLNKGYFTKPSDIDSTTGKVNIQTVQFESAVKPKRLYNWFKNCSSLTEIKNMKNLYTNECTDMRSMFSGCSSLTTLDLSTFDTSNVTNMISLFDSCESLQSLDLRNFDTRNVTTMGAMFADCKNLTTLQIGNWNTSNVTNMLIMFYNCEKLKQLDLRSFNTQKVTKFGSMFENTSKLQEIIVGENWDTSNGTTTDMYTNCGINN